MILLLQETIGNMTISELTIIVGALIVIAKYVVKLIKLANIWRTKKNKQEEKDETIEKHSKQISDMDTRHKEDYQQINTKIDSLTTTLQSFIEETKKDNQVILRDKIYEVYKTTIKKGYILEKDSKNYHYALERYLANGGNSYVCEEIQPRMSEFLVFLSDSDAEEHFKKSR